MIRGRNPVDMEGVPHLDLTFTEHLEFRRQQQGWEMKGPGLPLGLLTKLCFILSPLYPSLMTPVPRLWQQATFTMSRGIKGTE